jgi:disulfide bond formation protein DsbB
MFNKITMTSPWLLFAWVMALFASLASIYFIEIQGNPAATLCWFERMLIFGILLLLTVGIIRQDINVKFYAIPFLLFGIPSALYQQLVHWNIINIESTSCSLSSVCTTKFFELFGFITQATLCLVAFLVVACCLYMMKSVVKNSK